MEDSSEPNSRSQRPILAVDVDGVISLFGWDGPPEQAPGDFKIFDGIAHCISRDAGDRLRRLGAHFEMIWATGWEERANEHLPPILGLPKFPYLTFDGQARFGSSHWKLPALGEYSRGRPLAWIDDCIERELPPVGSAAGRPDLARSDQSCDRDRGVACGRLDGLVGGHLHFSLMDQVWVIIFMGVVLKIPVGMMLYTVYWAVKATPDPETSEVSGNDDDHGFGRRNRRPGHGPNGPRRDPHTPGTAPIPDCPPAVRARRKGRPAPLPRVGEHSGAAIERSLSEG